MIVFGETPARSRDRRRAAIGTAGVIGLFSLAMSAVSRPLGVSYPVFSLVLGISIVMMLVAAILLWAQSQVTGSASLLVLAAGYGATAIVMVPYMVLFHGLWPLVGVWLAAEPQASPWLWFAWHLLFATCPLAYVIVRRFAAPPTAGQFSRLQTGALAVMLGLPAAIAAPAIWVRGLPSLSEHGIRTSTAWLLMLVIAAVAVAAIAMLYAHQRFGSVLELWLALASLCLVADMTLSLTIHDPFTVGWYVSRVFIIVATGSVLVALLLQTAMDYGQLAKTADHLRDESLTDALTGLANRRSFDIRLEAVLADGARMSRGAALLMIDVDTFKLFNEAYGHVGGDNCLRDLCSTALACVSRTRDMIARYGGEEIAVLMVETDASGAMIVAERIRTSIEALGIPQSHAAAHPVVTVSIGATAVASTAGLTSAAFIDQADRALYRAKETGRNRTVAWPFEDAPAAQPEGTRNARGTLAGSRATIS